MFIEPDQGATAPPVQSSSHTTLAEYETVRHLLYGSLGAIQATIKLLHMLNYAEPNDWSKPIPTGRGNEMMVTLTKKVRSA